MKTKYTILDSSFYLTSPLCPHIKKTDIHVGSCNCHECSAFLSDNKYTQEITCCLSLRKREKRKYTKTQRTMIVLIQILFATILGICITYCALLGFSLTPLFGFPKWLSISIQLICIGFSLYALLSQPIVLWETTYTINRNRLD